MLLVPGVEERGFLPQNEPSLDELWVACSYGRRGERAILDVDFTSNQFAGRGDGGWLLCRARII